jgi:DNA repair protein RecO (recombination protein O)
MVERAQGLILRTRPLTDTSLIVHWLTPTLGRIATVAKGARRSHSPFRGRLDLFYLADFSFSRSRRSELHTLREVLLRQTNPLLRRELACLQQASYFAALIEQTTETDTPLPTIFPLLAGLLDYLPAQPPQPLTIFAFEVKLLTQLGLAPSFGAANLTAGARRILETAALADWATLSRLKLTGTQTREANLFLEAFLAFHLGKIPESRTAALGT